MTFDSRWKNPQGSDPRQLYLWAQDLIKELRRGEFLSAGQVSFDNTASGLAADTVQEAIDENDARLDALPSGNDTFTRALLHFDGADAATAFPDGAYGALTGAPPVWTAAGNAQVDTAESQFGGASGLFDGTGDSIATPSDARFDLGSGDFTVDAWFNCVAPTGSFRNIAGRAQAGGGAANRAWVIYRDNGDPINAEVSDGTTITTVSGTTPFTDALNTGWHHVALVRTGNTLKLFIDGVQEGGDVAFSGSVNDLGGLAVGAVGGEGSPNWQGWTDEFRLSVGIARWTANFTPPTLPYGPSP